MNSRGYLTDNFSWRWVFYINLPVGLASVIMTRLFIFDPPYIDRRMGVNCVAGLSPGVLRRHLDVLSGSDRLPALSARGHLLRQQCVHRAARSAGRAGAHHADV